MNNLNCKIYTPNSPDDSNDRSVFVWVLNPFYFWHSRGNFIQENNANLKNKMDDFIFDLKAKLGDDVIQDHHFIAHLTRGALQSPKQMTITFNNKEKTLEFIKSDTFFNYGILIARHKKLNVYIPIKKCNICQMTNHRKGDPRCDLARRCPRCLNKEHFTIEGCTKTTKMSHTWWRPLFRLGQVPNKH